MQNLDVECANLGRELAQLDKVDHKTLTSALGVLEEQGVYACFLFLNAQGGPAGQEVSGELAKFLQKLPAGSPLLGRGDLFTALQALAGDVDKLLFARDLLRQALVYGRYHAKAKEAKAS
ncbi:MAG: hypothetical protein NZV14_13115 [Bryobacteraceae bacterium]|nr:hypothetical protein [Bryobacteraceae bacterium]MDW8379096.1 hypothetical protein [Bryobacterales bacterium]